MKVSVYSRADYKEFTIVPEPAYDNVQHAAVMSGADGVVLLL
jgi:hypothetical protein